MVARMLARGGAVLGTVALLGALSLAGAGTASAHVVANPETAAAGGYTVITFRVPTESTTAGTVGLRVTLPADRPITSARTEPVPGWTAKVVKGALPAPVPDGEGGTITQAVREITWTANPGVRIGPSEFSEFRISAGPLPSTPGPLLLPATQTYDDGKVVAWSEPPGPEGSPEPEHPAPSVMLVAAEESGSGSGPGAGPWLGGAGLILGAAGLVLSVIALARTRRGRSNTQADS